MVERLQDEQRWKIDNGGRQVYFSIDEKRLAWTSGVFGGIADTTSREIWISQVDGSQARSVYSSPGAGVVTWLADGRILVSEWAQDGSGNQVLSASTLADQPDEFAQAFEIARAPGCATLCHRRMDVGWRILSHLAPPLEKMVYGWPILLLGRNIGLSCLALIAGVMRTVCW